MLKGFAENFDDENKVKNNILLKRIEQNLFKNRKFSCIYLTA